MCCTRSIPTLQHTRHHPGVNVLHPLKSQRREGPTGLDVGGSRPTSPRGWNTMMQALRQANVGVGRCGNGLEHNDAGAEAGKCGCEKEGNYGIESN